VFANGKEAGPAGLDHRFAEHREARGDLETAAAWPPRNVKSQDQGDTFISPL